MNELKPYIEDGVCRTCGVNVEQESDKYPVHVCLVKLDKVQACGVCLKETGEWTGPAYWLLGLDSACDKCIMDMLEKLPDNRQWLEPALADIRARHLKIGQRVRIVQEQCSLSGEIGTIYARSVNVDAPWLVRPDGWGESEQGIPYPVSDLDVLL